MEAEGLREHLQRQLAQVRNEQEVAKLDLESLGRSLEGQLLPSFGLPEQSRESLLGILRVLRELPAEGAYQALRSSVREAQQRCQDLSGDALRSASGNELAGTLRTLKTTNKRLIWEAERQRAEVNALTHQRLLDVERFTQLEQVIGREQSIWMAEAQRQAEAKQKRCDQGFDAMQCRYATQLHQCHVRAKRRQPYSARSTSLGLRCKVSPRTWTVASNNLSGGW